MASREHTLSRLLRERGHHLSDPTLFARARAEAHNTMEAPMPTAAEYWWASVDGGAPVPVSVWREAGLCEEPPRPWGAERLGHEGVLWPDRVRLIARIVSPIAGEGQSE